MSQSRAVKLRPRLPDIYDPDERYSWVVEIWPRFGFSDIPTVKAWIENNTNVGANCVLYARLVGFVDYDDAMLFYLAHA